MSAAKRARPAPKPGKPQPFGTPASMAHATVFLAVTILAGCSGVPIPPTYTQDELRAICERQRGWWHPNGLVGGYCEYDSRL